MSIPTRYKFASLGTQKAFFECMKAPCEARSVYLLACAPFGFSPVQVLPTGEYRFHRPKPWTSLRPRPLPGRCFQVVRPTTEHLLLERPGSQSGLQEIRLSRL